MRLSRPETEKKSRVSFQDAINAEEQSEKKKGKKIRGLIILLTCRSFCYASGARRGRRTRVCP